MLALPVKTISTISHVLIFSCQRTRHRIPQHIPPMLPPKLCPNCKGIWTVHGVVAGSKDCESCILYGSAFRNGIDSTTSTSRKTEKGSSFLKASSNRLEEHSLQNNDVLLGRGKFANGRPANRRYRRLLEEHCEAYSALTTQRSKTEFTKSIVQEIRQLGRFLKPLRHGGYEEISDAQARVKVGQVGYTLRENTKPKRRATGFPLKLGGSCTDNGLTFTALLPVFYRISVTSSFTKKNDVNGPQSNRKRHLLSPNSRHTKLQRVTAYTLKQTVKCFAFDKFRLNSATLPHLPSRRHYMNRACPWIRGTMSSQALVKDSQTT